MIRKYEKDVASAYLNADRLAFFLKLCKIERYLDSVRAFKAHSGNKIGIRARKALKDSHLTDRARRNKKRVFFDFSKAPTASAVFGFAAVYALKALTDSLLAVHRQQKLAADISKLALARLTRKYLRRSRALVGVRKYLAKQVKR